MLRSALKTNWINLAVGTLLKANRAPLRTRYHWKMADCKVLQPPENVRGMKKLCRETFRKQISVPCLRVREEYTNRVLPVIKEKLLKMQQLKPVRPAESSTDHENENFREILLHPMAVQSWESLPIEKLSDFKVLPTDFYYNNLELSYANWRADEILDYVLSNEIEGLTSYSRIGHIIHLNLRDHLLPYKQLIAEVFADKLSGVRTVVNKMANIDNTYRNFELELLHGVAEYKVETKENGIVFEFDFSRVYWNPRLSTEHERIVKMLQPNDVLYDVFAGVGPFSVPAAKKRCSVLANDLNPESFRWLTQNMKRNKCTQYAELYNKDGRDFIVDDIKADLLKRWREAETTTQLPNYKMHITMNLPALAPEFLDAFRGLIKSEEFDASNSIWDKLSMPLVHVYTFAKGDDTKTLAVQLVEDCLGLPLGDALEGVSFVRNVAPNKDMYRVTFQLTKQILTTPKLRVTKRLAATQKDEDVVAAKQHCS